MNNSKPTDLGPFVYENWRAALEGHAPVLGFEFPLFTDAHITGMIQQEYGPYQLLNPITPPETPLTVPRIILRLKYHLRHDLDGESMKKTDTSRYHGGSISDEVAALVSLSLGIRLKAGSETRMFSSTDAEGRPLFTKADQNPVLIQTRRGSTLPSAKGTKKLEVSHLIAGLPKLSARDAVALVRAARLYQDGLWMAESEPEIAWLLLVSAIETAAGRWRRTKESNVERLWASKQELAELLQSEGGDELVHKVADLLAHQLGATKKFRDFVLEFLPGPPVQRPPEYGQHSWNRKSIRRSMNKIYEWRSRALHGGIPFPSPMCTPPQLQETPEEVPLALASYTLGGTWVREDTPMLLHTFEYIVRGTLHNWMEYMLAEDERVP